LDEITSKKKSVAGRKIRVGVIGAGLWATYSHIPNLLKRREEVELVGVCRLGAKEVKNVAEKFGFSVASEDFRDIIDLELDLIVIASPARFHYEQAKASLLSGAHILIEKPVTLLPEECWELQGIADRQGLHGLVSYGWNYQPAFLKCHEMLQRRSIGNIENVVVHMGSGIKGLILGRSLSSTGRKEDEADTGTYSDTSLAGGGYMQSALHHVLGWLFGMTDLRAREVSSRLLFGDVPGIETQVAVTLGFDNDAIGVLSGSAFKAHKRHQASVRIYGSQGQVYADLEHDLVEFWFDDEFVQLPLAPGSELYNCDGPPNTLIDLVQGKSASNFSNLDVGARAVEVVSTAYQSYLDGGRSIRVRLPDRE